MIHPSYRELMDKINEENAEDHIPEITSRYSVVLATSKRARELTNGARALAASKSGKALSIAVEEFYEGKVRMNPDGNPEAEAEERPDEAALEAAAALDEAAGEAEEALGEAAKEAPAAEEEIPSEEQEEAAAEPEA